jgi:hypothetical protein
MSMSNIHRLKRLSHLKDRLLDVAGWLAIGGMTSAVVVHLAWTPPQADVPNVLAERETETPTGPRVPMPEEVRGVYMTANVAGSKALRDRLTGYLKRNDLNAIVIDIKEAGGQLAFIPASPTLRDYAPEKPMIPDLKAYLKELGESGVYRIARQFVFQDPMFANRYPEEAVLKENGALWSDHKGVTWVDPASKKAWKYNADVAREAFALGFDEVQLDYIRFPSDGNMSTVRYSRYDGKREKRQVIGDFFRYMHRTLEQDAGIPISYDLFGFATWHTHDMSIGQMLVDALPYATAISAMVYPSHYPPGTIGFANPADHPYEIIADSLRRANELYDERDAECAGVKTGAASSTPILPCDVPLAHHRPWIQAFDIGAVYTPEMIRAQIKAVRDQHGKGWLLWNARNVYKDFK